MFEQEASWIGSVLEAIPGAELGPLLDIGSSNLVFRTEQQPWIQRSIFDVAQQRGATVLFCDLKDSPGVDIVADLLSDEGFAQLSAITPQIVLCCNVLEHVLDAREFAARLGALVPVGGRVIVTVPHRYPHHNDPIDTMFRPNVEQAASLFAGFAVEQSAMLKPGNYRQEFARRPLTLFFRHLFRLPVPFLGWSKWKRSVGKLQYLFHSYEVTALCLRKVERPV